MKNLLLVMLLMIPCVIISQNTNLEIKPDQVKNIYIGLKQNEVHKSKLSDCILVVNDLNAKMQILNDSIRKSVIRTKKLLQENKDLNKKYTEQAVDIKRLENRKIPWYKHPITYIIIGFASGVYLMK